MMKYRNVVIMCVGMILMMNIAVSQPMRKQRGEMRERPERLEKFRKMRLIEVLKLNEEESIRFFAKQNAHEDRVRGMMDKRNDALDDVEKMTKDKNAGADLQKRIDQLLDIDQQIFAERQKFQKEMRQFLTAEQFARFMLFQRNFGNQVRDALGEMSKERKQRFRERD
jgi:hypothetical protein